jgi:putative ABC transport system permease protein
MDTLLKDLRYALRRLRKSPAFSAIVILTLALGIGANTAIFSVVNAVLLRPLPYQAPDRLTTIEHFYPSLNGLEAPVSATGFKDYRDKTRSFATMAIETGWNPNLTGKGEPERLTGRRVSGLWFRTLGVTMQLGRPLLPDEDAPGQNKVVVIGYQLWQRIFSGSPSAVGQTMVLNGESYQVVGVMRPTFRDFFARQAEIWTPLAFPPSQYTDDQARTNEFLSSVARLKDGVTLAQAQSELRAFAEQLKQQYPDQYPRDWSLHVTELSEKATGRVRPALLVLLGAVGFVLLIACANVANLLLARAAARLKEVAIRTALGAKRWQLVRQLLTESVLLAVAGGVLGLGLATLGIKALVAFNPSNLPRTDEIRIDGFVMLFTLLLSLLTGLIFGLVPALQTSRASLQATLKEGGRSGSADRGSQRMQRVLIVATFALALSLLAGAGLLIKSFARLQAVSPGFNPDNVLTFNLAFPRTKYPTDTQQTALLDRLLPRLAAVPGVQSVGMTSVMPFGGSWATGSFSVEGFQRQPNQPGPWGDLRTVSPDYFKALGIALRKGRTFTDQDRLGAPRVAIVDEQMVKRFWPNTDPIGKRLAFGSATDSTTRWITVVGVVDHAAHEGLDADPRVQFYVPYPQNMPPFAAIAVRTAGDPQQWVNPLRLAVHDVDKDLPLSQVRTMDELIESSVGQRRLSMVLLGVFAAIALALASIGIYGVMSYFVTQRVQEIGVRMALGAAQSTVLGMVLRQGMRLAAIGVVIGLLGAFALTRLMATQLFGVKPNDPATYVLVSMLLAIIAVAATLIPALRATRVDPVVALRQE